MKRLIFLLLGIVLTFNINGQDQKDTIQDSITVYCDISIISVGGLKVAQGKIPGIRFYIDSGNKEGFFLKDKDGNEIHFWTRMAGINYMSKLGWELVQCYIIPKAGVKGLSVMEGGGDVYYIMKKKIKSKL